MAAWHVSTRLARDGVLGSRWRTWYDTKAFSASSSFRSSLNTSFSLSFRRADSICRKRRGWRMRQRTREQEAVRYARRKGTHRSLVHRFVGPRALRRRVCRLVRGATHRLCVARGEAACRGAQEGATTTLSVRMWTHQPAAARCLPASAAAFAPPCWARTARAGAPARALSGSSAARAPAAREVRRTAATPRRMARRASPRHQEAGARVADCKRHVISAAGGPRRPSFRVPRLRRYACAQRFPVHTRPQALRRGCGYCVLRRGARLARPASRRRRGRTRLSSAPVLCFWAAARPTGSHGRGGGA